MDFTGRYHVPAPPEAVWAGLTDPAMLAAAIPGCEALDKSGENEFSGAATIKIGPMKARFKGKVALSQMEPPHRLVLTGNGDGGVAGFVSGTATILLTAQDGGTELTYTAGANVGGKLAQIGQRLIDGAARQIADQFFARFAALVAPPPEPAQAAIPPPPERQPGSHSGVWAVGLIGVVAVLLAFFLLVM